jgi:hypothetical protein
MEGNPLVYQNVLEAMGNTPMIRLSKLVPAGKVIITEKAAVKFFVKREAGLEQSRDIEKKENTIVYERHGVIALVDDTSSVILGKAAPALTVSASLKDGSATLTVTGKSKESNKVYYMADADAPLLGDDVSLWHEWDGTSAIEVGDAKCVAVAEVDAGGITVKSGCASLN